MIIRINAVLLNTRGSFCLPDFSGFGDFTSKKKQQFDIWYLVHRVLS